MAHRVERKWWLVRVRTSKDIEWTGKTTQISPFSPAISIMPGVFFVRGNSQFPIELPNSKDSDSAICKLHVTPVIPATMGAPIQKFAQVATPIDQPVHVAYVTLPCRSLSISVLVIAILFHLPLVYILFPIFLYFLYWTYYMSVTTRSDDEALNGWRKADTPCRLGWRLVKVPATVLMVRGVLRVSFGYPLQGMHPFSWCIYLIILGFPLQESERCAWSWVATYVAA